jgi:hypothetical protein
LSWGKLLDPVERFLGYLHLVPWEHSMAFDLSCGDVLTVVRPADMLKLDFGFQGLRFSAGAFSHIHASTNGNQDIDPAKHPLVGDTTIAPSDAACRPGKCLPAPDGSPTNCARLHCKPGGTPLITVIFPPQHIQEQAFFHGSNEPPFIHPFQVAPDELNALRRKPNNPNLSQNDALKLLGLAPAVTPQADSVPAKAILSGESRLVFKVSKGEIPFDLEHLLDWSEWEPQVHPVAETSAPAKLPKLPANRAALDNFTAIELPYRLVLSPTEKGRWAHAQKAVPGKNSKAVELWHTRLGTVNTNGKKAATPDENDQTDRTARAIYSPDLDPSNGPLKDHNNADPRFSLDAHDRQELVHLTSNFRIPPPDPHNPKPYVPSPVQLDHLMLTPLGGYLRSLGRWDPPMLSSNSLLTIEEWQHTATLARDQ